VIQQVCDISQQHSEYKQRADQHTCNQSCCCFAHNPYLYWDDYNLRGGRRLIIVQPGTTLIPSGHDSVPPGAAHQQ